jgi:hypothetical protein
MGVHLSVTMKQLALKRVETRNDVLVDCADGEVSVYRKCAYCRHCSGVLVGKRVMPSPQKKQLEGVRKGSSQDEDLLNAAIMFNTLIRDGTVLMCDDDENKGFESMY